MGAETPNVYSRTFDNHFNVVTETFSDGMTVERTYDSVGRALSVGIDGEVNPYLAFSGHYRGGTPRLLTYLDGTGVSRDFNALGFEVSLEVNKSGVDYRSDEYEYFPGGSVKEVRDLLSGSKQVFGYDGVDRIKHWAQMDPNDVAQRTQNWVYDAAGNVDTFSDSLDVPQAFIANEFNQYTQVLPALPSIVFGLGGEEGARDSAVTTRNNTWDAGGKLTEIDELDAGVSIRNTQVEYWPDGLVKSRTYGDGTSVSYWYDAVGNIIGTESGGSSKAFVHFRGMPVLSVDGGAKRSMVSNWRGDLVTMDTPTGFESYVYTPYGELGNANGGVGQASSFVAPIFGGAQYDKEFGFVQFGARTYDPALGRFISRDPIGLAGGTNLYRFANNNPYKYIDPSGFSPERTQSSDLGSKYGKDGPFEERDGGYFPLPGVQLTPAQWFEFVARQHKGLPPGALNANTYNHMPRSEKKAMWAAAIAAQEKFVAGLSGEDRDKALETLKMYYGEQVDVILSGDLGELLSDASDELLEVAAQAGSDFAEAGSYIAVKAYEAYDYADTRREVWATKVAEMVGVPPDQASMIGAVTGSTSPTQVVKKGWRGLRKLFGGNGKKKVEVGNGPSTLHERGVKPKPGTRIRPAGVPDNWKVRNTRTAGGTEYYNPMNTNEHVRVMQGNPNSPFPSSRSPYIRARNSAGDPIDKFGNPVDKNSEAAHIPLGEWSGWQL